jgi:long-chain acyl-CoA synthetase
LDPGDRVAILLANAVEWVCFEQAALALGLVVVPLYPWDSPENLGLSADGFRDPPAVHRIMEQWHPLAAHVPSPLNCIACSC